MAPLTKTPVDFLATKISLFPAVLTAVFVAEVIDEEPIPYPTT